MTKLEAEIRVSNSKMNYRYSKIKAHTLSTFRITDMTDIYIYINPIKPGLKFKQMKHPHQVKRGTVHTFVNRAKVVSQDRQDFNREIKNIKHDLILHKYPQHSLVLL
jgi:hypothetical protein